MTSIELVALAGFVIAVGAMLLVTQTKERVAWPAWLVPAALVIPFMAWTVFAISQEGLVDFWSVLMASPWGAQLWLDRLMSITAAFFLLQNRSRAIGMKSEVWVLATIFTGSIGLMLMLAQTLRLEHKASMKP